MLLTAVGASLDGAKLLSTKAKLQSVADAAALMAMAPENIPSETRKANAMQSIDGHMKDKHGIDLSHIDVTVGKTDTHVRLVAEIPQIFGAFLGKSVRRVAVSSRADETYTSRTAGVSVSFVIDLSESMNDRLGRQKKIDATRRSVSNLLQNLTTQFGGNAVASDHVSSGVYAYNWGAVDAETVPLEPGTIGTLQSLSRLNLDEGRVQSAAVEQAVSDHMDAIDDEIGTRRHYMIFITDGDVDDDRADQRGRYLSERDMYRPDNHAACRDATDSLERAERALVAHYNHVIDQRDTHRARNADGELVNFVGSATYIDRDLRGDALIDATVHLQEEARAHNVHDNNHVRNLGAIFLNQTVDARERYILACQPIQADRVVEACLEAREEDVSMIAVNLSGEDGTGEPISNLCAFYNGERQRATQPGRQYLEPRTEETLPSGLTITVSEDGTGMTGSPRNERDLSEMLSTILEQDVERVRTVRLLG